MFQALKKAYAEASDVDAFLATLLAKHDAAGARAQLKTLWIGHVCALFQEDEEAPEQSRAGWGGGGGPRDVRARAHTPPHSPLRLDSGDAAWDKPCSCGGLQRALGAKHGPMGPADPG